MRSGNWLELIGPIILTVMLCVSAPLVILRIIGENRARKKRIESMLENWATSIGARLIEYHVPEGILPGPFFWTAGNAEVFMITVEYPDGFIKSGSVRCGSWSAGILSDEIKVKWDPPKPDKPKAPGFPVIMKADKESGDGASPTS